MIGSAILFQNANCGKAFREFPHGSLAKSCAVSFVASSPVGAQENARHTVSKIAKLMLDRKEFDAQAKLLTECNVVFADAK